MNSNDNESKGETYFPITVSSLAPAVEAVVGRRWRDSWRRFCTPLSLLNEECDFETLCGFVEKLPLKDS